MKNIRSYNWDHTPSGSVLLSTSSVLEKILFSEAVIIKEKVCRKPPNGGVDQVEDRSKRVACGNLGYLVFFSRVLDGFPRMDYSTAAGKKRPDDLVEPCQDRSWARKQMHLGKYYLCRNSRRCQKYFGYTGWRHMRE